MPNPAPSFVKLMSPICKNYVAIVVAMLPVPFVTQFRTLKLLA
jgi:hypothetical protein